MQQVPIFSKTQVREQLGKKREGEIIWRNRRRDDEVAIKGESFVELRIIDKGFDDGVGDECIWAREEREDGDGEARGERAGQVFDEMTGDERVVVEAGGEELGEDLGEVGRGADEGDEGTEDWGIEIRVTVLGPN